MRRPLLIPAVALLAWALAAPAQAPAPLVARVAPILGGVQVVRTRDTLGAVWSPVRGQALVCAVRVNPKPQEPLEPCLEGGSGSLAFDIPIDINLQVWPGDLVELQVYDERRALLAIGRAEVSDRWRTFAPVVGK